MAILVLFFCSGATALVYEVIWSKYLALLFGSTIQAQTVVLAVFMGGLALGNRIFGRFADRAQNSLGIYGRLEIAVGIYAFLFSLLYHAADAIFASVGSGLLDRSGLLLLLKGALSVALLIGPTIAMGGTFPILAGWLQKSTLDAGRRSALFYSINSLGAVCGAGAAGFWLVERFGLRATMDMSAAVNLIIGLAAIVIGTTNLAQTPVPTQSPDAPRSMTNQSQSNAAIFRLACILVALTGAVSMGLEVLATRCLALIFGASLQVFSIVLMAFILGIGAGSAVIASPRFKRFHGEVTAVLLMLGAASLIALVVFNIENLVAIYLAAQSGLSFNLMGYRFHRLMIAVISFCVLGLPAAALGSVLPLWIRIGSDGGNLLGDRVGRLLTWNTLGAVVGSLMTGFVLMPDIGLRGSFTTLASVLVVAAVLVAIARPRPAMVVVAAAVGVFVITASLSGDKGWRYVFSSGIFRQHDPEFSMAPVLNREKLIDLDFYEDAADATVSVERTKANGDLALRIDGKVDASARGDASTQLLLAYLPLMLRPESKDVFCFGMGSGITAGATLNYPIDHLTVAENCGPVLRAAKLFEPWNNGVLTSGRTRIYHEDARTVLKLAPRQYDVIISEPSNPWMIGVASVFTKEFYQLAAKRLKPGGLIAQWFHTYEMDDANVDVVLRTFGSVFPNMEIWDVDDGDIVIIGSDRPWKSDVNAYAQPFQQERLGKALASIGLLTPQAILARRMASQRTAFAIAGPGPVQGDDTPILEYSAPRTFYLHLHTPGVFRLQRFDERTWQMNLASAQVNNELATLSPSDLKYIFGMGYGSANDDLAHYLSARYAQSVGRGIAQPIIIDRRAMTCSLQGTNKNFGIYTPPSAATNEMARQLAMSEYGLLSDEAHRSNAIDTIANALNSLSSYPAEADWSPDYYADLAIKASLRASDRTKARAILIRGLQLEPQSDQLGYLSRILVREGTLQPADISSLAAK
jgi:predicted membrane-bound spermidine synthase